jgi:hypothetical protein
MFQDGCLSRVVLSVYGRQGCAKKSNESAQLHFTKLAWAVVQSPDLQVG